LNKTLGRGKNSAWIGGVTVAQEQVCWNCSWAVINETAAGRYGRFCKASDVASSHWQRTRNTSVHYRRALAGPYLSSISESPAFHARKGAHVVKRPLLAYTKVNGCSSKERQSLLHTLLATKSRVFYRHIRRPPSQCLAHCAAAPPDCP
jgi:hypothetical protein